MYKLEKIIKSSLMMAVAGLVLLIPVKNASAEVLTEKSNDADPNPKAWRSPHFSPVVSNMYLLGGLGFYDVDAINSSFSDNGYSELKSPALSLGLAGDLSIGRIIAGIEGHWLKNVGTTAERDDLNADINSRYWLYRIGVDLAKWRGLRVYPILGIGTAITTINLTSESGASFNDVLENPGRDVTMSQRALLIDASLGIDYRFKIRENEYKSSFFTVGVRGGYLFAPYSGEWKTGSAEISGGPEMIINGPTVQLMLGFSGERKKRHEPRCNCTKHKL